MTDRREHHDDALDLILRITEGDRAAFDLFYQSHSGMVRGALRRLECPANLVDDLTQEVFLRIWQHGGAFRGRSSVTTYLFGIARNVLFEERRRPMREVQATSYRDPEDDSTRQDGSSGPDQRALSAGLGKGLHEAMGKLSPKQREALDLYYRQEMSLKKAANQAGCSVAALESRLRRARKALGEALGRFEDGSTP